MFRKIVHFSIRKKLFVAMATIMLLAGGIYSMLTLPILYTSEISAFGAPKRFGAMTKDGKANVWAV